MRALAGTEARLFVYVEDLDGSLTDADGTVEYRVEDGSGELVDEGEAERQESGVYTVVTDGLKRPDRLTVTVEYAVDGRSRDERHLIEVVGSRLVPMWLLRETIEDDREDHGLPASISDEHTDRILREVEDTFTSALGWPPFLRPWRGDVWSRGGRRLRVPRVAKPAEVYELELGGDLVEDATSHGHHLRRASGAMFPPGEGSVWLAHGVHEPAADLQRAALVYGRELARKSQWSARATEVATEGAVFSLATPGSATPTGVPEVDGVLIRHRLRV